MIFIRWRRSTIALAITGMLHLFGCGERASEADCAYILDRIVELELQKRGYGDPVLHQKKVKQIHGSIGETLNECAGCRLPLGAMDCVAEAESVQDIVEHCLR